MCEFRVSCFGLAIGQSLDVHGTSDGLEECLAIASPKSSLAWAASCNTRSFAHRGVTCLAKDLTTLISANAGRQLLLQLHAARVRADLLLTWRGLDIPNLGVSHHTKGLDPLSLATLRRYDDLRLHPTFLWSLAYTRSRGSAHPDLTKHIDWGASLTLIIFYYKSRWDFINIIKNFNY